MQISVYARINIEIGVTISPVSMCILLMISGTQIYLGGDKVYVQRVTDIASFQHIALIKTSTTTTMLMVIVTKLANGKG